MKSAFLEKLIERLDRLDPDHVQTQFLRLARERGLMDTIFNAVQEGLLVIDAEGKLQYANRAAADMLGFSLEHAEGHRVGDFLRGVDWDLILDFDEGEWSNLVNRELEITYPRHRFLNFYMVPLAVANPSEEGAVVILRDVTREREHQESTLESERLSAVTLLAAGVAHEIGNPLNSLTIHLQLLEREMEDLPDGTRERVSELVDIAHQEVSRLDQIINQFLRAVRPSPPNFENASVLRVLQETLRFLKPEIDGRNVLVEVEAPDQIPASQIDRAQIKQAFFNIVRNAIQAMNDGGILRILLSHNDTFVGIAFTDNGSGISSEDISHLFEPYHTTKEEGSGLGLMIVQRIVRDHGGEIEVRSEPGTGTTVSIFLPLDERRIRLLKAPARTDADSKPAGARPMSNPSILIVEDEKNTREGLSRALRRDYDVMLAEDGRRALAMLSERPVDIVLSDIRMPGIDGITLMKRVLAQAPDTIFILITAYGSIETAVEATKYGAFDFMTKPVNLKHLDHKLQQALRSRGLEAENEQLHEQLDDRYGLETFVGRSPAMEEVFDTVRQVSPSRANVLIEGESGTGKELVAHAIHRLSPRNKGPFVAVHCAALSENLLESELFGHEKGAFTGASERRIGRFEKADGGTLFLDEIGEIDPAVQVKILRVLEERQFERVGGQETIEVDVRLIAATNRSLRALVDEGTFREDLYFRLFVVAVDMPPLRERGGDIPLLIKHFLNEFNAENGKAIDGLTPDALDVLSAYAWPGNVRELRNVVERMVVMARGTRLTVRDVPAPIRAQSLPGGAPPRIGHGGELSLEESEKHMILKALRATGGNKTRAAEELGISRRTLHRKLNTYGLRDAKS